MLVYQYVGLMSSLRRKDDEAEKRLVNSNGTVKDEVLAYLSNNQNSLLGSRNQLSSYRNGIKWNPHDLCRKITLVHVIEKKRISVLIRTYAVAGSKLQLGQGSS